MNLKKYVFTLLIEMLLICFLFLHLINFIINLNIYSSIENFVLWSVIVLGIIYSVLKILSLSFNNQNWLKILPIAYSISIYAVLFHLQLTNLHYQNLGIQITMLAMFFIIANCIDKVFENYSNTKKRN